MWKQLSAIVLLAACANAFSADDFNSVCSCKAECGEGEVAPGVECPAELGTGNLCCNAEAAEEVIAGLNAGGVKRFASSSFAKKAYKRLASDATVNKIARSKAFKRLTRSATLNDVKRFARSQTLNDVKRFARSSLAKKTFKRMARDGTFQRLARSNTFKHVARSVAKRANAMKKTV